MNIEDRLRESERLFEQKKQERDQHLQAADECLVEMTKLQGEFRLLQQLLAEQQPVKPNKKPNVIDAVPEKEDK